jgi:hypothetical protein
MQKMQKMQKILIVISILTIARMATVNGDVNTANDIECWHNSDCFNHGSCSFGTCYCNTGYGGKHCSGVKADCVNGHINDNGQCKCSFGSSLVGKVCTKRCGPHGTYSQSMNTCVCKPHWNKAGITSLTDFTGDYFAGTCSQYQCESSASCQNLTDISDSSCPIKGWNCYCPFGHLGYDSGEAKCMTFMYWLSFTGTKISWLTMKYLVVPAILTTLAMLPFGERKRFQRQRFRHNFAWSIQIAKIWIWVYLLLAMVYVTIMFIWSLIMITIMILVAIAFACAACASGCNSDSDSSPSSGSCDPSCLCSSSGSRGNGGGGVVCCWGDDMYISNGRNTFIWVNTYPSRNYSYYDQYDGGPNCCSCFSSIIFTAILGGTIGGFIGALSNGVNGAIVGIVLGFIVGTLLNIDGGSSDQRQMANCCCCCFRWIPKMRAIRPKLPDNMAGGLIGWITGIHPSRDTYKGGNWFIDRLKMNNTWGSISKTNLKWWDEVKKSKQHPTGYDVEQIPAPVPSAPQQGLTSPSSSLLNLNNMDQIAGVPVHSSSNATENGAIRLGEECPVCMDKNTDMSFGGCCHTLCYECMKNWTNKNPECPCCRAGVGKGMYNSYMVRH